jgi:2-polyprenyl-3-methyl-5-hydroxy-6-metoxy-1,4-benzoquinol methylase
MTSVAERQMATVLEEVREDHLARYQFAVEHLKQNGAIGHVLDAGCGIGYGSALMSEHFDRVTSVEISQEAYAMYQAHWQRPNVDFHCANLLEFVPPALPDAIVCFEFIEHVSFYHEVLAKFASWSPRLIISTPNEKVRPHLQEPVNPFHFRHFTPEELEIELARVGYRVDSWHCQLNGSKPKVLPGTGGKFIIALATRTGDSGC